MSNESDRIPVPTNGHERTRPSRRTPRAASRPRRRTARPPPDRDAVADPATKVTSPELDVAVTPAQLAVGFGVVAGLVLLVLGGRRRRGKG